MLRAPQTLGEAWFHVNAFGDGLGRVWTVQLKPVGGGEVRVWTAAIVEFDWRFATKFEGRDAQQPRGYVRALEPAQVEVVGEKVIIRTGKRRRRVDSRKV